MPHGDVVLDGAGFDSGDYVLRYDYDGDFGGFDAGFSVSWESNDDPAAGNDEDILGIGASFGVGPVDVGLGYQKGEFNGTESEQTALSVGGEISGVNLKAFYIDGETAAGVSTATGSAISGTYTFDAITVGANYVTGEDWWCVDFDGMGAWVDYSITDNLIATAAFGQREALMVLKTKAASVLA